MFFNSTFSNIPTPANKFLSALLCCVFLPSILLLALATDCCANDNQQKSNYQQLDLFSDVLYLIQKNYVENVPMDKLVNGAINGMLAELDPHSSFMPPDVFAEFEIETKGEFSGIGVEITVKDHMITVITPITDTPAAQAGIKSGDKIIKIDGKFVKDLAIVDAIKMMRGTIGDKITITILRDTVDRHDNQQLEFTLIRKIIHVQNVKQRGYPSGIGYLKISQFQEQTGKEANKALITLTKNAPLNGLVLDLRNNPGGLLDQAVAVADLFLNSGDIVSTKGRQQKDNFVYHATSTPQHDQTNYPIIVLINSGSASAAEIVAGALQDQHRALILGTQSFGKGSVQSLIPLDDKSALRLTTARYYTPSGRSIQALGITPDIIAEQAVWQDKPGNELREKDLEHHFSAPTNTTTPTKPLTAAHKITDDQSENQPYKSSDYQLLRALDILQGWQQLKKLSTFDKMSSSNKSTSPGNLLD